MSADDADRSLDRDSSSFQPLEARAPDDETLTRLSSAGFSRRGLDAVGGVGTAASVGRRHRRALRAARRRRRVVAVVARVRALFRAIHRALGRATHAVGVVLGGIAAVLVLRALMQWIRRR